MPHPRLSILVTTHHRPQLLQRALRSILTQANQEVEILLCADESSAETRAVAAQWLRPCDSFVCTPHLKGPAETRNLGMQLARGQWLCMLDDDDTYADGHLAALGRLFDRPAGLYYFNYQEVIEERQPDGGAIMVDRRVVDLSPVAIDVLMVRNFIPNNALMVSLAEARRHPVDRYLQGLEDWDWLIALRQSGLVFAHAPAISTCRLHYDRDQKSRNRAGSFGLDSLSVYRKWPAGTEALQRQRAQILAECGIGLPTHFL